MNEQISNTYPKVFGYVIAGIVVALFVGAVLLVISGSLNSDKLCPMMGCVGGVHVNFVGKMPDQYTVEINFPSGKRKIVCDATSPTPSPLLMSDTCEPAGVFFVQADSQGIGDLPPEELTVTVTLDDKQVVRKFRPEYTISYPNGKDCGPMCYRATINFDLSDK